MLYRVIPALAFVATVLAAPAADNVQCPRTICVDAINTCGVRYGGCYDQRKPELKPTAPPCSSVASSTTTDDCSTRTVCADYINECGQWYGGCFPDCKPWPTFSKPVCTSTTTSASVTTVSITTISVTSATVTPLSSTTTNCHNQTICADYINECGQTYGGCFSACKPYRTFTAPACTTTTTAPSSTCGTICRDYLKTCSGGEVLTYGG
jgi:hypothetical protein